LNDHFKNKNPNVRAIFDKLVEIARKLGPLTVYAQKTRIVFMVRVRFGGVITRKNWLFFSLWLTRPIEHPKLNQTEIFGPNSYGHQFQLSRPEDIDKALADFIKEGYLVGSQEHLNY
jgi:hypothetical protein